jgi:intein/homing endonuclease
VLDRRYVSVKLPELSPELAEFLGALAGDGHLAPLKADIVLVADYDLDTHYITEHIPTLIRTLFGVNPRVRHIDNFARCYFYSKILVNYLHNTFDIPVGKKKNRLHIPKTILANNLFLVPYLRGLFDTDGCIHQHHPTTAAIEYVSADSQFTEEVYAALKSLGFRVSKSRKSVYIYAREEINKFFAVIEPANKKHINKYHAFLATGKVPRTADLLRASGRFINLPATKRAIAPVVQW